ncbi:HEPN domain-containing protein [Bacillus spizizenii]|nr:HEPN domain-containing protein [Bacillus spizizenii]
MNREEFQRIAEIRAEEAIVLFENQKYDGAYYLAGYAIECALKACIAKKTRQYDFPPNAKTIQRIYTHNLNTLLQEAGLQFPNDDIETNWLVVKDWTEQARYTQIDQDIASDMIDSALHPEEGVYKWLKTHW